MSKNKKWLKWLEFTSVRTYLSKAINSKNTKINDTIDLDEKVQVVSLTPYMRGLELFLNKYAPSLGLSWENDPSMIITHWKEIRDNDEEIAKFTTMIENYTSWLKNDFGKSATTSKTYQASFRGFLKWNNIILKFRNYEEDSEKAKRIDRLGIDGKMLKEMSFKIIGYIKHFDVKMLLRWCQISGLGSKEILSLTFGDLRHKLLHNGDEQFIKIKKRREKTNVSFITFLYGDVKRDITKYINQNAEKGDNEYIFGDPKYAYQKFQKIYKTAYNKMIEEEYPELFGEKSVFTIHGYRSVFISTCVQLRVPKKIENLFVAHKTEALAVYEIPTDEELLGEFKKIQESIFGVKTSTTEIEIEKKIVRRLTDVLMNKGKRETIFRKYQYTNDSEKDKLDHDKLSHLFIQNIIEETKKSLREDKAFKMSLLKDEDFKKELFRDFKKYMNGQ